jgi:hypothetical protein
MEKTTYDKKEKPKLTDPEEWAIIRKIYFEPKEETEEMERERIKRNQKNQAR